MTHRCRWAVFALWLFGGIATAAPPDASAPPPHAPAGPQVVPAPTVLPVAPAPVLPAHEDGPLAGVDPSYSQRPFWIDAEWLVWWMKNGPAAPPLLTTSSTLAPLAGVVGGPGTQVLYGGNNYDYGTFSGMRLSLGETLCDNCSLEIRGFITELRNVGFSARSDATGNPLLIEPFLAVGPTGATGEAGFPVSVPGFQAGSFQARSMSRLWGTELNVLEGATPAAPQGFAWFVGVSYLQLDEDLQLNTLYGPTGPGVAFFGFNTVTPPAQLALADRFLTRDWFLGGQLGARQRWSFGQFFLDARGTLAVGATQQEVIITGTTRLLAATFPAGPIIPLLPGGLYAQGSNIGGFRRDRFSYIPSVELKVGWNITDYLSATIGSNALYWSSVVRPGDQISRSISITQIPGFGAYGPTLNASPPLHGFTSHDFWAAGLTAGLELRF